MRWQVELKEGWYKDAAGVYLGTTKEGRYVALMLSKKALQRLHDWKTSSCKFRSTS